MQKWQDIQLNLPDTPIRDLVIKDNDIVIGSHGRGFWILDDIQPIRQYQQSLSNQSALLFKPADAIRGVYDAKIQYYLEKESKEVTFEILDENNRIISTHIGDKPEYQTDPNIPWWRRGRDNVLHNSRISWFMLYSLLLLPLRLLQEVL